MTSFYMLQAGKWTGLTEAPARPGSWGSSPVFVTGVKPLKTGLNQLEIDIVQPLHLGGSRRRTINAQVVQKGPTHLTCLFNEGGESHTAVMAQPDFAWLSSCCPDLVQRRPPSGPMFIIAGEKFGAPNWEEYLEQVFGCSEDEVLHGTHRKFVTVKLGKMPKNHTQLKIHEEFEPIDSIFISRGFKPLSMEEKWFVIHENSRLIFWRSWTGIQIYDVEAYWRENRLYLGMATVNRNPKQYKETDDGYDVALLRYIIDVVLRGVNAPFPTKASDTPASLQAWSSVGAASLD